MVKPLFYSSIMADVLPWWLVLLPLLQIMLADVIAIVASVIATCFFFFWLMLLPLGTFVLADVIAMVADVITTQGVCRAVWQILKPIVVDVITTSQQFILGLVLRC